MGHISAFFYYVKNYFNSIKQPVGLVPNKHLSILVINKKNQLNPEAISTINPFYS